MISVIVPLEHDRGQAVRAVRSWAEQSPPADGFEILVTGDAADPAWAAQLTAALGGRGRLLAQAGHNTYELYHRAALEARGETLLFTESHCLARPGCLAALAARLAAGPAGIVNLEIAAGATNHVSRIDARVDRREWARLVATGDWRAVSNQGVAVARATYLGLGGFSFEFGGFAWSALALRAARAGVPILHAKEAVVEHVYRESLREMAAMTASYARGEVAFRRSVPAGEWRAWLGEQPLAARRASLRERAAAGWSVLRHAAGCHSRRAPAEVLDARLAAFQHGVYRAVLLTASPRMLPAPRTLSPWRAAERPAHR